MLHETLLQKRKKKKPYKNARIFQPSTPPAPDITGVQLSALLGGRGDGCQLLLGVYVVARSIYHFSIIA